MSRASPLAWPSLVAPLLLVLIVCGGRGLASYAAGGRSLTSAGGSDVPIAPCAALELVLPGLFAWGNTAATWPFEAPAPPHDHPLVWRALAPQSLDDSAALPSLYVGLIPLWLAIIGLWPARSSSRRWAEVGKLALFALALAVSVLAGPLLSAVVLSLPAALGLRRIGSASDGETAQVRPQLVAAAACVVLTVVLIALSLRAGFATDAQALRPLLARLDPAARAAFDPASLALEAAHLRAVLDHAALAAFVGMTALLLHLKSRAAWSAALLLAVAAADVVSVAH